MKSMPVTGAWRIINKALCLNLLIWLILSTVSCSGQDANDQQQIRKEPDSAMTKQYTRKFADARRSSFVNIASSSMGNVTWQSSFHDDEKLAFSPDALLNADNCLVAYNRNLLVAFDTNGKRLWSRNIRPGSPVSIFDGKVYYRDTETEMNVLSAVLFDGSSVKDEMYILDSYDMAFPIYLEYLTDGFLAMCMFRPMPEEGGPETSFYRKEYGTLDYGWVTGFDGEPPLLPLHIPKISRMIVFKPDQIAIYNSEPGEKFEDEEEIMHFKSPMETLAAASCDSDGSLYLLGIDKEKNILVVLSADGKEMWRWTQGLSLSTSGDNQPPVIGIENSVYIASGKKMMTVSGGQLVREFETDGESINYITVLADGSVLIAADLALYRVSGDGEVLFSFEFDHKITAPAIAGSDGSIYVATTHTLTRID
jgi:outer membrane protein assembly factor BamB